MATSESQPNRILFSPGTYLRNRRPEQFSDSIVEEESSLNRSILEYHLETLTSRSQELLFETFARKLAQKVICPNLIPHTGPSGGGDSKVDTETFPVTESLANAWYVGAASSAFSERWAFAFSAKKDWKPKAVSDIEKIALTDRDYKKAFFVSNQFIPDRVRAKLEDDLTKQHEIEVRILDRTWILDNVFDGCYENLAIDELGIVIARSRRVRLGPRDEERRTALDALEQRIKGAAEEERFDIVYVEDCLDAAIASRELEMPQLEVEGRFIRAEKAAKKWGNVHQKLQAVYQRAWTLYFWYEEFDEIPDLYLKCENLVIGTNSSYELELLSNLWFVVHSISIHDASLASTDWMKDRTRVLLSEADRLAAEECRPSNALQSRTIGLLVKLNIMQGDREPILRELRKVVESCEGLIGFPARSLFNIITDLGEHLGSSPEFERLFESTVRMTSKREGELVTAKLLLKRGGQQLVGGRIVDVIRVIGRALRLLYRHESREQMVSALYMLGRAYHQIGLLWAARGSLLTASSIAANDFYTYGSITAWQAECAEKLKWIELELGRIPQSWDWHQLDMAVKDILARQNDGMVEPHDFNYDAVMGIQILRLSIEDLKHMQTLVYRLEKLGLPASALALRYALGHETDLPAEFLGEDADDPQKTFIKWLDQPAREELKQPPSIGEDPEELLTTTILGCRIMVSADKTPACMALAETILASLESLMSTTLMSRVIPFGPRVTMKISSDSGLASLFEFSYQADEGLPNYEIQCSAFNPHKLTQHEWRVLQDKLSILLVDALAHAFHIVDLETQLTTLIHEERALERALNFTQSFMSVGNVLGHNPKTRVSEWIQGETGEYPLLRTEKWDAELQSLDILEFTRAPIRPGVGPAPDELVDEVNMTHTDFQTTSVIRPLLWDAAEWNATGFFTASNNSRPPGIALVFKNKDAAAKIFEVWRKEFGDRASEDIRISIIKGIDKRNPFHYRIAIGSNPESTNLASKFTIIQSRVHTMTPESSINLDNFLKIYEHFKCFLLVPAFAKEGDTMFQFIDTLALLMGKLVIREAWEIGPNDNDIVAITEEDDPIIPNGIMNPPFLEALSQIRKFRGLD